MKNAALLLLYLLGSTLLIAQSPSLSHQAIIQQNGNWIEILPEARIQAEDFFDEFLYDLGLDVDYHFELLKSEEDKLGFTHYRYQEHFNGVPVEGGTYILHVKDGFVSHANGKLIRGISESGPVTVSAEEALDIAKEYMNAETFYWEIPEMEARIKHIKKDPNATFYPEPELVIAQASFSLDGKDYKQAWKYELYMAGPDQKKTVFVDAISGSVLFALEGLHDGSVEGVAETRYHGTRTIITDSVSATEYRLIDATRGGGIETYDLNQSEDISSAVDFLDEDNYWNNVNASFDDAATDVHWGSEMTYDYFLSQHDRNSFDDEGGVILSYLHYGTAWANASNNGLWSRYGDGNSNPWTSIDIVAHEIGHAVNGTSAGLIYLNESGALNESYSDIWGAAVESFALGDEADWLLGAANFIIRDMSDPNAFGDPDTYEGTSWFWGIQDNGGVHTNSGVQNFWFYLLSVGGQGTNDNGDVYSVPSIGIDDAAAIAYRNLTVYLTESSNFLDARIGAIQAAEDIYGTCSEEVLAVAEAWYAVGVGPEEIAPDFQVVEVLSPLYSSCDIGSEEQISMNFRFNPSGCGLSLEAGDEIEVSYQLNSQDPIVETIVLTETLNDGEMFTHDFQTLADLSEPDIYLIDYTVSYLGDLISDNDEISNHKVTNPYILEADNLIEFDHFNAKDSIFTVLGNKSEGSIQPNQGYDGSKGFVLSSFGATLENTTLTGPDEDFFGLNPDFVSKVCMCADLSDWDEAYLNFDLRQTYSNWYVNNLPNDIDYMIALRVTADGQQIGAVQNPNTHFDDPFVNHVRDFSAYAGTSFTLCFESLNFISEDEDGGGELEGDKSQLDNIFFSQSDATGIEEDELYNVDIYPNPTSGLLNIELDLIGQQEITVIDILGNAVMTESWMSNGDRFELDISELSKGIYTIVIQSEAVSLTEKVLLD